MGSFSTARIGPGSLPRSDRGRRCGHDRRRRRTVRAQGAAGASPTFTKDVAPILQRSCQQCHRPGAVAPMSLLTYQEARPWARSIKTKVTAREMPPWHIDRNVGITKFKDDPSLTDAEIATIAQVGRRRRAAGQSGRHAAAAPVQRSRSRGTSASPTSSCRWTSRTCCRPTGPTTSSTCWSIPGFKEDMYVMAIESKPADAAQLQGRPSLHDQPGRGSGRGSDGPVPQRVRARQERRHLSAELGPPDQGRDEDQFQPAPESARRGDAGQRDARAEGVPEGRGARSTSPSRSTWATPPSSTFPPGRSSRHDGYFRLPRPALIASFQPHMHNRGKAQCMEAIYPDVRADSARPGPARIETISCVSNYQFGWHITYPYADDVAPLLPAGTIVHITVVARQHRRQPVEPEPEELGRRRRAVDRRDELRVGDASPTSTKTTSSSAFRPGRARSRAARTSSRRSAW